MKKADLLAKCPPDNQQRFDQLGKIREAFDKLPDPSLELRRRRLTFFWKHFLSSGQPRLTPLRYGLELDSSRVTLPGR
jgi:hypothetical protein